MQFKFTMLGLIEKETLPFLKAVTKSFDAPFMVNASVYAVS